MARIAVFSPIVTLDMDTQEVTVDFSASLQSVQIGSDTGSFEDEQHAGVMMDKILDALPLRENQAQALRNLASHIDNYVIQEIP